MEKVLQEQRTLKEEHMKGTDPKDYAAQTLWDGDKKELKFTVNVIKAGKCWRLVYKDNKVLDLFESDGETSSLNSLFGGTEKECLAEIERLELDYEISEENIFLNL